MFEHVEPYPGDPILSLNENFQHDPRPHKINLSIGIYFDDAGRIPVLESVRRAEQQLVAEGGAKPYQPIEGAANCRLAVQQLLFGPDHPALKAKRIATIQSVGSSGSLRVGADFIRRYFPASGVWVSDPTWDNHRAMFEGAGLKVHTYPYYDATTDGLRFDAMCEALRVLPARSVVLLHACCHNPTGVDLTRSQWEQLIPLLRERELLPFLDLAYQGYGDGIDEDAFAPRALADAGLSFFIASSFSKSMSLYGERCGALSVVCPDAAQVDNVLGQLKATVRRNYSSPPIYGGQIVARVLTDARAAPVVGKRGGRDARAHRCDAQATAQGAERDGAAAQLRLLPDAARHVQLHRPDPHRGRHAARAARGVPRALGPPVRGRAQHEERRADGGRDGRGARCNASDACAAIARHAPEIGGLSERSNPSAARQLLPCCAARAATATWPRGR